MAGVLLLALADRAVRLGAARLLAPTGAAHWIWSARDAGGQPRAFYAVKDFTVAAVPARAPLLVLADEEYILYLNGRRVGSNVYTAGAGLDLYDASPLLQPGPNRLVAELRSGRGQGGFLLRLAVGEGGGGGAGHAVVSDGSWRLFHRFHPGLLGGWLAAEEGEPPRLWGRPPTGRWGRPAPGPPRPLFTEVAEAAPPVAPVAGYPLSQGRRRPRASWTLWDWGRPVTGYLSVEFGGPAPPVALLFEGEEPPPLAYSLADGPVIPPPGATAWDGATVRRFRYALLLGPGDVAAARVHPVPEAAAGALPAPPPAVGGAFGLPVPQPLMPAAEELRHLFAGPGRPDEPGAAAAGFR